MRIRSNETQPYEKQVLPSEEIPIVKSLSEERSQEIPQVPANPIWKALGKSADIVYDVAQNMMEVERQEQFNSAQVEMSRQLTQARLDIINDPRYLQSTAGELTGEWSKRSKVIKENALNSVKHNKSKTDLAKSWQAADNDSMVYFTSHGWQNTLIRDKNQRDKSSVQATMDVVNAEKPSEEPFIRMKKMYDDAVAARTITREEADKELQAWLNNTTREYFKRQFIVQIQESPNYDSNAKELTKAIAEEKVLDANDKTVLLHQVEQFRHSAEIKAKQDGEVEEEKSAYAIVYSKFGGNNAEAAKWLRNPKNLPDMKLTVRNRLAATFEHMDYVQEQAKKDEQDKVMNDFLPRIYGSERTLTSEDIYNNKVLSPQQKEHFLKLLQQPVNKKDFTTDWNKYNARLTEAYRGDIKNTDDIFSDKDEYGNIGVKDREHIWRVAKAAEKVETKAIKTVVEWGNKVIQESTLIPSIGDAEQTKAKKQAEWEKDLNLTISKGLSEGKELKNMLDPKSPDYIVDDVLSRHTPSRDEQIKNMTARANEIAGRKDKDKVVVTPTPGAGPPKKAPPTIDDINTKLKYKSNLIKQGYTDEEVTWAMNHLESKGFQVTEQGVKSIVDQRRKKQGK